MPEGNKNKIPLDKFDHGPRRKLWKVKWKIISIFNSCKLRLQYNFFYNIVPICWFWKTGSASSTSRLRKVNIFSAGVTCSYIVHFETDETVFVAV